MAKYAATEGLLDVESQFLNVMISPGFLFKS